MYPGISEDDNMQTDAWQLIALILKLIFAYKINHIVQHVVNVRSIKNLFLYNQC